MKYFVPLLNEKGGIQNFAESIYKKLNKNNEIRLYDWQGGKNLLEKALLRLPPAISKIFFKKIMGNCRKKLKYSPEKEEILHFWDPDPAMAFLDKKYILSIHGTDILPKHLKGIRKKK